MSVVPQPWPQPAPQIAADIASMYRGKRERPLPVRDKLGGWLADEQFAGAYGVRGKPGWPPARLALVAIFQKAENLADRQAAEAVRTRMVLSRSERFLAWPPAACDRDEERHGRRGAFRHPAQVKGQVTRAGDQAADEQEMPLVMADAGPCPKNIRGRDPAQTNWCRDAPGQGCGQSSFSCS